MQAFPLAASGTWSITAGVNTASMHQQRSGLVPVALAFSMAQILGSWQIGQRVGSIVLISFKPISKKGAFNPGLRRRCSACCACCDFCLSRVVFNASLVRLLDAEEVSWETTPLPPPPPRHTLFTQRRKVTVSDPANSFVVMLKCRFNRHHTNRTVTGRWLHTA